MMTASELGGVVLVVGACWPALSPRVATGIVTSTGLFLLALAGIAYTTCTGDDARLWLLGAGVVMVAVGEVMAWRAGERWWWVPMAVRRARPLPGRSKLWRD